ncbi:CD109 antigen-like isoform X2 [Lycorma delicatula]|uniref:CD109 antigen-like isoform X2 n=1 Tax=Lycorma delicatula TaxID=130591 RepID=UPI003F516463
MDLLNFAAFLFFTFFVGTFAQEYYTIVGPRILRPNSDYHVAVTAVGVSQPTTVIVEVGGKQDSGGSFKTSQFITVEPYVTRILKLEIGDLGPGLYNLTAKGTGGMNFFNSSTLQYVHKSYSVFIQTDKAIYKPGHKILFRAVVLNSHLKPSVTGTLDIFISDGKGNRVKQWNRVLTTKGVFSGELQLSENPVLGDWNITITVLDQVFHKSFQVAEYVLPKFEVTIDVPKHATFKDSKVVATVRSKYTYGRNVKGEATITAYPMYFSGVIQPIFQAPIRKVIPIDGKATAEFDIVKELKLTDDFERPIQFDVAVEEALTGRRQNNSAQVMLHKHKYKMDLIKTSEYFKPGLKYTAFIKLAHHDGTPVTDKTNPVRVRYGYSYNSDEYTESSHFLSQNGLVELTYYPPANNVTTLGIEADYLDIKEWFSTVSPAVSPSNTFIQAIVKTETPTVNSDVEIEVNSTAPLKYVSYEVLGRGDVVVAATVPVSGNQKTASWRFLATYAMAPTAHVVVQFIREDGEVVADALDIELNGVLQNFVNVRTNTEETEPGANVEISLEAKPNSYIGVLGIDQSVLLLKSGNDIEQEHVFNELRSYDSGEIYKFLPYMREAREKRTIYWWPGSFTAEEAFEKSGALIMTNGYVHEHRPWLYFRSNFAEEDLVLAENLPQFSSVASAISGSGANPAEGLRVRSKFPETWIWELLDAGLDGKTSLFKSVPDTITSWVITAFSVDPLYGLGLLETPRKMRVFRPFFVSLDLPYSVIRGEVVAIPVVVFNYMNRDVTADVTLENTGQFEFADQTNDVNDVQRLDLYRRRKLTVRANSGATTSFLISPKELGYINIKVTATSNMAGDVVERKLLVKAEGETQYMNKAIFIDLRKGNSFSKNVTLDIPVNVVPGSELIEVSAVGDILGPSIPNLANLIKMPHGCGEQNMLNFVPNIVILEYLKNTQQLRPAVATKAVRYMETGYQQELTYKRKDGSFSAFGSADPNGSTWLTAFVVKSFRQATPHINIEENVMMEALQWLASNQAANGSFPEVGQVSHTDMQGGAAKGLALTAYTLIAFLENSKATSLYRNTINKGIDYIVRNLDGLEDAYAIAISSFALHLAQHPDKNIAFNLLENKAQSSDEMKWWKRAERETDMKNPWNSVPNSVDVEMTAYGLLTYIQRGLVEDSFPIVKWLISQQNDQGGFASTQDTVIALSALAKLAESITVNSPEITVSFSYAKGSSMSININKSNAMILQKNEVPRKTREIQVNATGTGFAIVQVSYRFNVNVTGAWPLFTLDPQVDKNSDMNHLQLSICSGFVGGNESNMAVMEVSLPSGFTVDQDALPSLELSQNVKRVETKDGDTVVMLYFDKMIKKEYCPTVSAFRTHKVAMQKPVPVTVYDYYDQTRRARVFYEPRKTTTCDICEEEHCQEVCSGKPGRSIGTGKDSASGVSSSILTVFIALYIALRFH